MTDSMTVSNAESHAAAAGKLGKIDFFEANLPPKNALHDDPLAHISYERSPGYWHEPGAPRELGEEDFNPDGSLKVLHFMSLDPSTAHIFRIAEANMKAAGDQHWGAAVVKAFEEHSPRDLSYVKKGLRQQGWLKE